MEQSDLKVGDKVCYCPEHVGDRKENGIVKEIPEHTASAVRVVYNCDDNWDCYKDYTSALTYIKFLKFGWQ